MWPCIMWKYRNTKKKKLHLSLCVIVNQKKSKCAIQFYLQQRQRNVKTSKTRYRFAGIYICEKKKTTAQKHRCGVECFVFNYIPNMK